MFQRPLGERGLALRLRHRQQPQRRQRQQQHNFFTTSQEHQKKQTSKLNNINKKTRNFSRCPFTACHFLFQNSPGMSSRRGILTSSSQRSHQSRKTSTASTTLLMGPVNVKFSSVSTPTSPPAPNGAGGGSQLSLPTVVLTTETGGDQELSPTSKVRK